MEEFSKIAFENNIVYSEENLYDRLLVTSSELIFDNSVLEPTFEYIPSDRVEIAAKFFEEFEKYHPDDAWYLSFIVVDPAQQRKGIGSFY